MNFFKRELKYFLWWIGARFPLLPSIMFHKVRPYLWRLIGVKIGKDVSIGYGVYLDIDGSHRVKIGNHVLITSECMILCHRRDLSNYRRGNLQKELSYLEKEVVIEDNVHVGMRSIIMPGVTVHEGAVIAAGSTVVKDVPAYTVVGGNPAKIIRELE